MLTIGTEDQTLGLVGKVAALDRQIDAAHLRELDALVFVGMVAGKDVEH